MVDLSGLSGYTVFPGEKVNSGFNFD